MGRMERMGRVETVERMRRVSGGEEMDERHRMDVNYIILIGRYCYPDWMKALCDNENFCPLKAHRRGVGGVDTVILIETLFSQ